MTKVTLHDDFNSSFALKYFGGAVVMLDYWAEHHVRNRWKRLAIQLAWNCFWTLFFTWVLFF